MLIMVKSIFYSTPSNSSQRVISLKQTGSLMTKRICGGLEIGRYEDSAFVKHIGALNITWISNYAESTINVRCSKEGRALRMAANL